MGSDIEALMLDESISFSHAFLLKRPFKVYTDPIALRIWKGENEQVAIHSQWQCYQQTVKKENEKFTTVWWILANDKTKAIQ